MAKAFPRLARWCLCALAAWAASALATDARPAAINDGWDDYDQYLFQTVRGKWRLLALQGNIDAISALNHMYFVQGGAPRDIDETAGWTRLAAAEPDNWRAHIELGMLHMRGQGVAADPEAARRLFGQAAATGGTEAMMRLAHMHRAGDGIGQDVAAAVYWYQTAAANGHAAAFTALGEMYLDGTAVVQDRAAAFMWFSLAADSMPEGEARSEAEMTRDITSLSLTDAEIDAARRRAQSWPFQP